MDNRVGHKKLKYVANVILLFVAYFVTARFGLRINAVSHFATLIWAPTGISTAVLLILGYRYWPGITAAAFLVNFVTGAHPVTAAGIAVGNTLEPLLGAYLLNRAVGFQPKMERVKDVLGLVFWAATLSTMVSATIGVSSLWLSKTITVSAYPKTWLAWWVGDMLGMLVIAPLILVWSQQRKVLRPGRIAEMTLYLGLLAGIDVLVFRGNSSLGINPFTMAYLTFPLMIWIALRFGQRGSVTATFVTSLIAIWITVSGFHASGELLSRRLLLLQSFMGVTSITFMTMAAIDVERAQTHRLRERLSQRANLLTQQRTHLLALNKAKDDFLMLASHQLRTPATSVKQYTGMLLGNYAGKLTKEQRELVQIAYTSNERQLRVVDALLRVAQVDAGKIMLEKEKVDLASLVTDILNSLGEDFTAKGQVVTFAHEGLDYIADVDKEKIRMALESIIDNASKYSSLGKEINIELKHSKNKIAVSVQDRGIGIAKKDQQKLFKKFSRINNPLAVNTDGNGLGLYWAKKIILLHKGSVSVDSRPNMGSTFIVTLPCK